MRFRKNSVRLLSPTKTGLDFCLLIGWQSFPDHRLTCISPSLKQLYLHLSDNPILIDSNSMALSFLYNSFTFTCWFGFWYLGLVSKPTLLSFQFLLSPNSIVNLHMPSRLKKINKLVKGCKWTNLSMTRTAQDKTCLCLFFLVNNPSSTSSLIWELTVYNTIIDLKLGCISL